MRVANLNLTARHLARLNMSADQARAKGYFIYREKLVNAYRDLDAFDFKILLRRSQISQGERSFLQGICNQRGFSV